MLKCGQNEFTKLKIEEIHSFHVTDDKDEDDEVVEDVLECCNGKNKTVKIFNQKCICFENPSVYAFRQCGHQCKCENCYISLYKFLLKTAVFRT